MCVCVRERERKREISEDRRVTERDKRGKSHREERETNRGLMVFRDQVVFREDRRAHV